MRGSILASILALGVVLALACSSGEQLPNFYCGGFEGAVCPPATVCAANSCGVPDCGDPCVANQSCTSDASCPAGYTCDAHSLCVPAATCTGQTCPTGQYCAFVPWRLSTGICVPVSALQQTPSSDCPWPFVQRGNTCGVPCDFVPADASPGAGCPPGMTCVNDFCN